MKQAFKRITALLTALVLTAVCACAENLAAGMQGEDVERVQQQLAALGYLGGSVDGLYGESTARAVSAFQSANGLNPTGEVNQATAAALACGGQAVVMHLQQRLIKLEYLDGEADGVFGQQSAAALQHFQTDCGLEPTGMVDDATLNALLGPVADELQPVEGDDAQVNGASLSPEDARAIQQRLIELGYLTGSADGIFGPKSESATRAFQQLHGLPVTGWIDDATRAALFSDEAAAVRPPLSTGDKGEDVQALQQRLIKLGFLSDRADGQYGKNTAAAVLAFQQHLIDQGQAADLGVTATGEAGSLTQEALFADDYSSYLTDVNPGDEGGEAARVERRLANLGYLDAAPDGCFDDYAVSALAMFQSAAGLPETGAADRAVIDALFDGDAPSAAHFAPHAVAMGDACGVVADVQRALIDLGLLSGLDDGRYGSDLESALARLYDCLIARESGSAELFAPRETLSAEAQRALLDGGLIGYAADVESGADADEILRLQRRLYSLFYLTAGGVDGLYGGGTRSAVEAFQEANGLPVTGVGDEATQQALFSADAIGNWTKYKLVVSTDDQRVYVYQLGDDHRYEQIKTFICSTGLGNLTPAGIYSATTEPLDRWHYFYKFKCWAQYAWRITGSYYFHSVLFSERDERTLRVSSVYNLGHKASHGCVRLSVEDAKWIYENCEAGTIVVIY